MEINLSVDVPKSLFCKGCMFLLVDEDSTECKLFNRYVFYGNQKEPIKCKECLLAVKDAMES